MNVIRQVVFRCDFCRATAEVKDGLSTPPNWLEVWTDYGPAGEACPNPDCQAKLRNYANKNGLRVGQLPTGPRRGGMS